MFNSLSFKASSANANLYDFQRQFGKERQPQPHYDDVDKHNEKFEEYYRVQGIIPDEAEFDKFLDTLREQLPTTWRFTGSKG